MMWKLTEQEDEINRVWASFLSLDERSYNILRLLYVEGQLYDAVQAKYKVSHATFEKYRKTGMNQLLENYQGKESVAELMRQYRERKEGKADGTDKS